MAAAGITTRRIAAVRHTRIATPRTAMAARRGAIPRRRDRRQPGRTRARLRGHSLQPAPAGAQAPGRRPVRAVRARTAAVRARARVRLAATALVVATSRAAKVPPAETAMPSEALRAAVRTAALPRAAVSAGRPAWAGRAHAPAAAAAVGD